MLDYIHGMGFDALLISPVIENSKDGYHGYWAQDFNTLNSNFGTDADLYSLVKAAHDMDFLVMVDVNVNHVAPVGEDYSTITPFNHEKYYHKKCEITNKST